MSEPPVIQPLLPGVPVAPDEEEATVQDSTREQYMRQLFDLRDSGEGRSGADAVDEHGNPFELKSTTTNEVTTGRDVGPHTVAKWRTRYWLIMKGKNRKSGFVPEAFYFLHPEFLDEWFKKREARYEKDLVLLERVKETMLDAGFSNAEAERLRALVMRGLTENNPKIPWKDIEKYGLRIDEDYAANLRRWVAEYPLDRS